MLKTWVSWPGIFDQALTIYIISPQTWNGLKVSKHHYASELASLGHHVFFIEPPVLRKTKKAVAVGLTDVENVSKVTYTPWFPYILKFHALPLFHLCMRRQAKMLVSAIGNEPDIVWDFDNAGRFADLRRFGGRAFKIFHPVDDIQESSSDRSANVILTVAKRFRDRVRKTTCPSFLVPHGLSRLHEELARRTVAYPKPASPSGHRRIVVGYVGNLAHSAIDWKCITRLVSENDAVRFLFIGPHDDRVTSIPLRFLRSRENVSLIGLKSPQEVVTYSEFVDLWLVCYDPVKSIDAATNSHKLLEYLSSGSPIVSSSIAAYRGSNLVEMPKSEGNEELPAVFQATIDRLEQLNAVELRRRRAEFALRHTYRAHLKLIDSKLKTLFGPIDGYVSEQ